MNIRVVAIGMSIVLMPSWGLAITQAQYGAINGLIARIKNPKHTQAVKPENIFNEIKKLKLTPADRQKIKEVRELDKIAVETLKAAGYVDENKNAITSVIQMVANDEQPMKAGAPAPTPAPVPTPTTGIVTGGQLSGQSVPTPVDPQAIAAIKKRIDTLSANINNMSADESRKEWTSISIAEDKNKKIIVTALEGTYKNKFLNLESIIIDKESEEEEKAKKQIPAQEQPVTKGVRISEIDQKIAALYQKFMDNKLSYDALVKGLDDIKNIFDKQNIKPSSKNEYLANTLDQIRGIIKEARNILVQYKIKSPNFDSAVDALNERVGSLDEPIRTALGHMKDYTDLKVQMSKMYTGQQPTAQPTTVKVSDIDKAIEALYKRFLAQDISFADFDKELATIYDLGVNTANTINQEHYGQLNRAYGIVHMMQLGYEEISTSQKEDRTKVIDSVLDTTDQGLDSLSKGNKQAAEALIKKTEYKKARQALVDLRNQAQKQPAQPTVTKGAVTTGLDQRIEALYQKFMSSTLSYDELNKELGDMNRMQDKQSSAENHKRRLMLHQILQIINDGNTIVEKYKTKSPAFDKELKEFTARINKLDGPVQTALNRMKDYLDIMNEIVKISIPAQPVTQPTKPLVLFEGMTSKQAEEVVRNVYAVYQQYEKNPTEESKQSFLKVIGQSGIIENMYNKKGLLNDKKKLIFDDMISNVKDSMAVPMYNAYIYMPKPAAQPTIQPTKKEELSASNIARLQSLYNNFIQGNVRTYKELKGGLEDIEKAPKIESIAGDNQKKIEALQRVSNIFKDELTKIDEAWNKDPKDIKTVEEQINFFYQGTNNLKLFDKKVFDQFEQMGEYQKGLTFVQNIEKELEAAELAKQQKAKPAVTGQPAAQPVTLEKDPYAVWQGMSKTEAQKNIDNLYNKIYLPYVSAAEKPKDKKEELKRTFLDTFAHSGILDIYKKIHKMVDGQAQMRMQAMKNRYDNLTQVPELFEPSKEKPTVIPPAKPAEPAKGPAAQPVISEKGKAENVYAVWDGISVKQAEENIGNIYVDVYQVYLDAPKEKREGLKNNFINIFEKSNIKDLLNNKLKTDKGKNLGDVINQAVWNQVKEMQDTYDSLTKAEQPSAKPAEPAKGPEPKPEVVAKGYEAPAPKGPTLTDIEYKIMSDKASTALEKLLSVQAGITIDASTIDAQIKRAFERKSVSDRDKPTIDSLYNIIKNRKSTVNDLKVLEPDWRTIKDVLDYIDTAIRNSSHTPENIDAFYGALDRQKNLYHTDIDSKIKPSFKNYLMNLYQDLTNLVALALGFASETELYQSWVQNVNIGIEADFIDKKVDEAIYRDVIQARLELALIWRDIKADQVKEGANIDALLKGYETTLKDLGYFSGADEQSIRRIQQALAQKMPVTSTTVMPSTTTVSATPEVKTPPTLPTGPATTITSITKTTPKEKASEIIEAVYQKYRNILKSEPENQEKNEKDFMRSFKQANLVSHKVGDIKDLKFTDENAIDLMRDEYKRLLKKFPEIETEGLYPSTETMKQVDYVVQGMKAVDAGAIITNVYNKYLKYRDQKTDDNANTFIKAYENANLSALTGDKPISTTGKLTSKNIDNLNEMQKTYQNLKKSQTSAEL